MRIKISEQASLALAEYYADRVHAAVVSMHLRVSSTEAERAEYPSLYNSGRSEYIAEIRAAVCSIRDPFQRRDFVSRIRYHFKKLREQHLTEPRWQNYKASVEAYRSQKEAA